MTEPREHVPYHERRLEQQMLDTLLRIEERLSVIGKRATEKAELVYDAKAPEEPEEKPAPKGKRR
jgi:hypothetical protein